MKVKDLLSLTSSQLKIYNRFGFIIWEGVSYKLNYLTPTKEEKEIIYSNIYLLYPESTGGVICIELADI